MAAARITGEGEPEHAAMSRFDMAAAPGLHQGDRVSREGDLVAAAMFSDCTTAARGACGGVPERAVIPSIGIAADRIAQMGKPGAAAIPVFRMAAARLAREDDP